MPTFKELYRDAKAAGLSQADFVSRVRAVWPDITKIDGNEDVPPIPNVLGVDVSKPAPERRPVPPEVRADSQDRVGMATIPVVAPPKAEESEFDIKPKKIPTGYEPTPPLWDIPGAAARLMGSAQGVLRGAFDPGNYTEAYNEGKQVIKDREDENIGFTLSADTQDIVVGLASLAKNLVVPSGVKPKGAEFGDYMLQELEAGADRTKMLVPGMPADLAVFISDPAGYITSRPVTFAMSVAPALRSVAKASGMGGRLGQLTEAIYAKMPPGAKRAYDRLVRETKDPLRMEASDAPAEIRKTEPAPIPESPDASVLPPDPIATPDPITTTRRPTIPSAEDITRATMGPPEAQAAGQASRARAIAREAVEATPEGAHVGRADMGTLGLFGEEPKINVTSPELTSAARARAEQIGVPLPDEIRMDPALVSKEMKSRGRMGAAETKSLDMLADPDVTLVEMPDGRMLSKEQATAAWLEGAEEVTKVVAQDALDRAIQKSIRTEKANAVRPLVDDVLVNSDVKTLARLIPEGERPPITRVHPDQIRAALPDEYKFAADDYVRIPDEIGEYLTGKQGGGPLYGSKAMVNALEWWHLENAARVAPGGFSKWATKAKAGVTARNPASAINNLAANAIMETLRTGNPLTPMKLAEAVGDIRAYASGKGRGAFGTPLRAELDMWTRTGLLTSTIVEELKAGGPKMLGLNRVMESFYAAGDNIFKLVTARRELANIQRLFKRLKDEKYIDLPDYQGQRIHRIYRDAEGNWHDQPMRSGSKKAQPQPKSTIISEQQVLDLQAKAAGRVANELYFDYRGGAQAQHIKRIRSGAGGLAGVVAPFYTWFGNAIDLPGKAGLGTRTLLPGRHYGSNSAAVHMVQMADSVKMGARRGAMLSSVQSMMREPEGFREVRRWSDWAPKDAGMSLITDITHPNVWGGDQTGLVPGDIMGVDSISSFNPYESATILARAIDSAMGPYSEMGVDTAQGMEAMLSEMYPGWSADDPTKFPDLDGVSPKAKSKALQLRKLFLRQVTGRKFGPDDAAKMIGISGGLVSELISDIMASESAGNVVNTDRAFRTMMPLVIGGAFSKLIDIGNTLGVQHGLWDPNILIPRYDPKYEGMWHYAARTLLGLGYRTFQTEKMRADYIKRAGMEAQRSLVTPLRDKAEILRKLGRTDDAKRMANTADGVESAIAREIRAYSNDTATTIQRIAKPPEMVRATRVPGVDGAPDTMKNERYENTIRDTTPRPQ